MIAQGSIPCAASDIGGDDACANAAFQDLLTYPKAFLENNGLIVYGGGGASGEKAYQLYITDMVCDCVTDGGNRRVPFWALYAQGSFAAMARVGVAGSAAVPVHYLAMIDRDAQSWGTPASSYVLPAHNGPDIMVTSKLNGCSFGVGSDGNGARLVTHLQPLGGNGQSAQNLTALSDAVDSAIGASIQAKATSSAADNATVIGLRSGGSWVFFVQRMRVIQMNHMLLESVATIR